jgi:hypothetical protein
MSNHAYFKVVYVDPDFDVAMWKTFIEDERLACQAFIAKLQEQGCKDVRVERLK